MTERSRRGLARRLVALGLAGACTVAAACGTRVPDERFDQLAARGDVDDGGIAGLDGRSRPPPSGEEADRGAEDGDGSSSGPDGFRGSGAGGRHRGAGRSPGSVTGGGGETAAANSASDVGVTPTEITVGSIVSKSGPLGPDAFMPMWQGANAYFQTLNEAGGVHGRRIRLVHCDDAEDPARNEQCVHELLGRQKVFALVGNATRAYAGARRVSAAGVPDVGGQPIGNEYWTYPTFFTIRGSYYQRDGSVGHRGRLYNQTLQFRFIKERAGVTTAAVVHYNVPVSQSYADFLVRALEAEGIPAVRYEVNVAFPNFDTVVADMRDKAVDGIWDVMDPTGNQNLCEAMQRGDLAVKAKVGTSNGWTRTAGRNLSAVCIRSLYMISESRPNADTSHAEVQAFRRAMTRVYGGRHDAGLHQWALEGWAAARLFTDGVRSMGPEVTRTGLIEWLNRQRDYTAGGLLSPVDWRTVDLDRVDADRECLVVAHWDDRADNFVATSPVPLCRPDIPLIGYAPA